MLLEFHNRLHILDFKKVLRIKHMNLESDINQILMIAINKFIDLNMTHSLINLQNIISVKVTEFLYWKGYTLLLQCNKHKLELRRIIPKYKLFQTHMLVLAEIT